MKSSLIRFVIIVAFWGLVVSAAEGILLNDPRMGLFPTRERCAQGVSRKGKLGWEQEAASLQAASAEKPQPLTKQEVLELVGARLPNQRIGELLRAPRH